jgi:hypothetical protein
MASDHFDAECYVAVLCNLLQHWRFQLFRAERHDKSQRHYTQHHRHLQDVGHMGGQSDSRMGAPCLANLVAASDGLLNASVGSHLATLTTDTEHSSSTDC